MAETIVVPVDFSETSLDALRTAVELSQHTGGEVHVVFVLALGDVTLGPLEYDSKPVLIAESMRSSEQALEKFLQSIDPKRVKLTSTVRTGRVVQVIDEFAKEKTATKLVLGTHGRSQLARFIVGSVAERVIRTINLPTLVVPEGCGLRPNGPIVVAHDFSATSERAIHSASQLATSMKVPLHVVHAYSDPWADQRAYKEARGYVVNREDVRIQALDIGMRQLLLNDVQRIVGTEVELHCHCPKGTAVEKIVACANEVGASMVCAGSTGKSGIERALLGSTAQALLRIVDRPLYIVH